MKENFAVIVNTNSSCSDIWDLFFGQLEKFFPKQKIYVFSDYLDEKHHKYNFVKYDNSLDFRTQYLNCLEYVDEKYCINMNDDYLLYDKVNLTELYNFKNILQQDDNISFIRVGKGYNNTNEKYSENLFYLDINFPFFYSQTVAMWKTETLKKIHELSPKSSIGRKDNLPQLEVVANDICKILKLNGLFYYNGENKRGSAHYDSDIFPYIASALVSGQWNYREYQKELIPLIEDYKININSRGLFL